MTNYEKAKASRNRDKDKEKESSLSNYDKALKSRSYNKIGMDTFEDDLRTTGSLVSGVYSKWQSPEALSSAYDQISNTQKRLSAYQDYNSKYKAGYNDMSDVLKGYDDILSEWNNITALHGQYKTADAFDSAMKKSGYDRKYAGSSYKDIQDSMKKLSKDSDEYDYLSRYSNYDNLNDLDLAIMGYKDNDHLTELKTKRNKMMLDNKFEKYKSVMDQEGFNGAYDSSITDEFYNVVNNGLSNEAQGRRMMSGAGALSKAERQYAQYSLDQMTDDEKAVFNHLYAQNPKEAMAYLKDMKDNFNRRGTQEMSDIINNADMGTAEQLAVASPFAFAKGGKDLANKAVRDYVNSALSIPANVVGGIGALTGALTGDLTNPYSNASRLSNMAGDIREQTSQDIADMGDGFVYDNVLPFLYQTGMSVGDSALGAYMFGEKYTPIMGVNAYQQKYRELKEAGESEGKAQATAFASGVAEAFFEKFSIESLFKEKGIDGARKWLLEALKQGGVEASEEIATEFANQLADLAIRQDTSDIIRQHKELIDRGYTKEEADHATQIDKIKDIIEAGLGGFLSGGLMQGGKGIVDYDYNKSTGASLRESGNDQRVLDALARLSDEESETYKAYTDYVNRGINQNTITDAQLGNLYNTSMRDDIDTFNDDKADDESRAKALYRMDKLSQIASIDNSVQQNKESTPVQNVELSTKETAKEYVKQYGAMAKGTENIDYELVSKFMNHEEVLDAYAEGARERDQKFEAKKMALAEKASKNHSVKGVFNSDIIDMSSSTTDGSKINWDSLTPNQQKGVKFLEMFSKATGVNITLIASKANESGKRVGELGSFTEGNNTIAIDIYSGMNTISDKMNAGMVNTLSHELTHWLEEKSGKAYTALRENVLNYLKQTGVSLESRIADEIQRNLDLGRKNFTEEDAIREIVARSCEDMLTNSEYAKDMLSRLSEEDRKTLVGKMKGIINDIRKWINKFLSEFNATTEEARMLRDLDGFLESTSKLWDQALKEAVEFNKMLNDDEENIARVEKEQKTNLQYADRDYGYHAGDLGKSESLSQQSYSRGTGHFGTGTYFVGNPERIKGYNKRDGKEAPVEKVNFSQYNLFKPLTYSEGLDLHDALKVLDGKIIKKEWLDLVKDRKYQAVDSIGYYDLGKEKYGTYYDDETGMEFTNSEAYEEDNRISTMQEYADSVGAEYMSYDEWLKSEKLSDEDDVKGYYIGYLEDTIRDYAESENESYKKFRRSYDDLKLIFGNDRIDSALEKTADYVEKTESIPYEDSRVSDSVATYFMKQMGYEGVDVRHIDRLDNTEYGSVIYDLKGTDLERKKEIGTARFSDRDTTYLEYENIALNPRMITEKELRRLINIATNGDINKNTFIPIRANTPQILIYAVDKYSNGRASIMNVPLAVKAGNISEMIKGNNPKNVKLNEHDIIEISKKISDPDYVILQKNGKYAEIVTFKNSENKNITVVIDYADEEIKKNYIYEQYANGFVSGYYNIIINEFSPRDISDYLSKNTVIYNKKDRKAFQVGSDRTIEIVTHDSHPFYQEDYNIGNSNNQEYMLLAENPNSNEYQLDRMVEVEARKNGYDTPILYHGSGSFGFTIFDMNKNTNSNGLIYATTKSVVSANYGGNGSYAGVRQIGKKYIENATSVKDIIQNAKTVFGIDYHRMTETDIDKVIKEQVNNASRIADIIDDNWSEIDSLGMSEDMSNKYSWFVNMFFTLRDSDDILENKEFVSENLASDIEHYNKYKDEVRQFFIDNRNNIKNRGEGSLYSLIVGYDLSDTAIDIEYRLMKALSHDTLLMSESGSITTVDEVKENTEKVKDFGSYKLYGKVGNNPLVIDANERNWTNVVSDIMGDTSDEDKNFGHSTDAICKKAKELGYTSVLFKNIYDGGEKADEYVFFNQEQVKSADSVTYDDNGNVIPLSERFNSGSNDIRFADRINTDVDSTLGIQRDNEIQALLDEIEVLKERVQLERQITGGNKLNQNQIYKVATSINTLANSKYNSKKLATELEEIYNYINNSVDVDATSVFSKFFELARNVVGEERETIIEDSYMKEIAKDIKLHRINLTPEMEKWLVSQYGSNFRQALRTLILFSTDGSGVSLDQRWQSLSAQYPETFDENITGEDQLVNLIEIAQATKEASYQIQKFNTDETIKDVAYAMYDGYWDVSPIKTTADVYQKQIKELKTKHKESQQKLRDRLDRQKLADDIHYGKIIERLRNQRDKARENAKAKYDRMEETREKNKLIGSITKNSLDLNKKFVDNSVKSHIPESMKGAVIGLINAIDYSSKSMLDGKAPTNKDVKLSKAMEKIRRMFAQMKDDQHDKVFNIDLPLGYEKNVEDLTEALSKLEERGTPYVLNDMSVEQLKELDKIVKIIKTAVNNINKWNSSIKGDFIKDCENGISELADYKQYKAKNDTIAKIEKTFLWSNANPIYAFERFGDTAVKVFSGVQDGWDKFAYLVNDIKNYAEKTFDGKECNEWEKEVHSFRLGSGEVKMTTAQLMSLYCLMKREHAREHLKAGGLRVNDFTGKNGKVTQPRAYTISSNEIARMLHELTPRQIEVADKLQKFMNNECKIWGNEVTMARYGFEAFDEKNYFPIKVNQNNVGNGDPNDKENSLFRLISLSFTNPLVRGANGSIELDSIFDVFSTHSTDMAKYNALALPVLDAFKWFSYKARESVQGDDAHTKIIERSMRESIERAFGKDANQYIVRFLQDLNGSKNVSREILGSGLLSSAKMASVGLNARVVALQPTSYVRALAVLDADDLSVAFTKKNNYKKAEKYCGIAMWKSLGFYDVNVGRGLSEMIKRNQTKFQKAQEASMALAGKADEITIGYLWNACEHNVLKHDKGLSGEALNKAVSLKLRDVIYHTQVVDSTMTRSELMRSADKKDKITTAFMSEPTLSYNMLESSLHQYFIEVGKNGSAEAFKKNGKNIARTMVAYTATNLVASIVEACFDALRSKKEYLDEEDLMEMLWSNFVEDMSIFGKIPVIKDIKSIFGGYSPNSIEFQGVEAVYSMWKEIDKAINGKKMSPYKMASSMLKAFSNFSGLALSNGERDIKAIFNRTGLMTYEEMEDIFNNIIGSVFPFLKV